MSNKTYPEIEHLLCDDCKKNNKNCFRLFLLCNDCTSKVSLIHKNSIYSGPINCIESVYVCSDGTTNERKIK